MRRLSADLRPTQVPVLLGLRFVLSLSSKLPFFLCSDHRVRLDLSQLPSLAFPLSKSLCSLPALWTCCPDTEVKCQPASGPLSRWSLPGFCSGIRQGRANPSRLLCFLFYSTSSEKPSLMTLLPRGSSGYLPPSPCSAAWLLGPSSSPGSAARVCVSEAQQGRGQRRLAAIFD